MSLKSLAISTKYSKPKGPVIMASGTTFPHWGFVNSLLQQGDQ